MNKSIAKRKIPMGISRRDFFYLQFQKPLESYLNT